MGRASRDKGKRGEREAAAELSRVLGIEAARGVQFHGGNDSPDVRTSLPRTHFEVKRVESLQLYPALAQAEADAGTNTPVVLHRRNGKPWVCVVKLDDLPKLAEVVFLQLASLGQTTPEADGAR